MKPIRYAVIGSGWRAAFYVRIAQKLPEHFALCMLLCRTEEKAAQLRQAFSIPVSTREEDVFASQPDFIVSAVSKKNMTETVIRWMEYGYPVLSETPAALEYEQMRRLWELVSPDAQTGADSRPLSPVTGRRADYRMQTAEQYWLYPTWDARIRLLSSGILGEPVSVHLSAMHDYHAASIIRRLLGTGLEEVRLIGKTFSLPVTDTRTRYETLTAGTVSLKDERHVVLEYESGRTAFYDFLSDQYRSPIRNRSAIIRGTRGEILNDTVFYLDPQNLPHKETIRTRRDTRSDEILSIDFRGQTLYAPPFGIRGLTEDETAIARLLSGMKEYLDTGEEIYPMKEALEDAFIGTLMNQLGPDGWHSVSTASRPWKKTGGTPS